MRRHNSQNIAFYGETLVSIYHSLVSAIIPQNEIDRDTETIRTRSSHERMAFLTKVLPALGKSIDVSLANGTPLDVVHSGFELKSGTKLPSFMYELFKRVFRDDGVPWFATWYSDIHKDFFCPMDLEAIKARVNIPPRGSRQLLLIDLRDRLASHLERGPNRLVALACYMQDSPVDMSILNEVCSSLERDAISLGYERIELPLTSDSQLNPLREEMVVALRAMRQVCFCFYKLKLPYTREQEAKTLADFVAVDAELDNNPLYDTTQKIILKTARQIICRVLSSADPRGGIPKHGPGSVATGEKHCEKHIFKRYYRRLAEVFAYEEWFYCNLSHVCDSFQELQSLEELEAGTAKVVLVQKDSRGPRLISCEPLEIQWVQQSLMRILVDTIESHRWTKGQVNFTYQDVNRKLALEGSRSYDWATLDMKEASDRVSLSLVKELFPSIWWEHLYASRSDSTKMPNGTIVNLKKFAPMGSAVCFPVESLIFWALSVASISITQNVPLRKAATNVYVYGDDIVCNAKYHSVITSYLPQFGLMLNQSKCCIAGPFKESCGMDAFFGMPVTPTKIRSMWYDKPEPSCIASYVEYSNAFYRSGYFEAAFHLEAAVQWTLRSHRMAAIPTVSGGEPGCIAFVREHERPIPKNRSLGCKIRIHRSDPTKPDYQRVEVQGYRLESKTSLSKTYGYPFLLRRLTEMEGKPPLGEFSPGGACSLATGQYPIAHRVRLKRAWTPLT